LTSQDNHPPTPTPNKKNLRLVGHPCKSDYLSALIGHDWIFNAASHLSNEDRFPISGINFPISAQLEYAVKSFLLMPINSQHVFLVCFSMASRTCLKTNALAISLWGRLPSLPKVFCHASLLYFSFHNKQELT
jgi:hypothetical protein